MLNRKQIAALAGLAPFNRDSGTLRGSRCIWGGRAQVRRVLYMATVAGVRCNPTIRTFYLRLRTNGKHAKPTLIACMRKFLVILNAMLHDKTHWQTPAHFLHYCPFSPSGRGFRTRLLLEMAARLNFQQNRTMASKAELRRREELARFNAEIMESQG
jgi:transposase